MGFTLTDVLLFGGAKESDADNAAFVIMRRNILRWGAIGGYVSIVVHGVPPLVLPDAIANSLSYVKAFGGTEQNGTPTPDAPIDIVCNNGVLKVLESATGITTQAETPTPANPVPLVSYHKGSLILRSVGEYADSYDATTKEITRRVGVKVLDGTEDGWTKRNNSFSNNTLFADKKTGKSTLFCSHFQYDAGSTSTIPDGCIGTASTATTVYFRNDALSTVEDLKQWLADQYAAGIPVTVYYPLATETTETVGSFVYTDGTVETIEDTIGNTATAEMLLKVGDYQDVQSILDGVVTRNVGVKAFDGTENWAAATTSQGVYRYRFEPTDAPKLDGGRGHCMSTHFFDIGGVSTQDIGGVFASTVFLYFIPNQDVDTVTKWTTYLANQYAAGTPVIVLYPLATPTTESVTGQTLQVTDGDNTLEITQASLTGLELEAQYNAAVSLTIQEVEDANLDNNVTVTIQ